MCCFVVVGLFVHSCFCCCLLLIFYSKFEGPYHIKSMTMVTLLHDDAGGGGGDGGMECIFSFHLASTTTTKNILLILIRYNEYTEKFIMWRTLMPNQSNYLLLFLVDVICFLTHFALASLLCMPRICCCLFYLIPEPEFWPLLKMRMKAREGERYRYR